MSSDLTPIPVTSEDVTRVTYWADRVRTELRRSVESIVSAGLDLMDAKQELGTIVEVARVVGISKSQAHYLMQIASHPVLSTRVDDLPTSWRALAELAQAAPEELERWIEDGVLTPDTTVKAAHDLVAATKAPAVESDPDEGETSADREVVASTPKFAELRDEAVFSIERGRLADAVALIMKPEFRLTEEVSRDILKALRPFEDSRSVLLQLLEDEVGTLMELPPFTPPRRVIPVADPRDLQQVSGTARFEASQAPHAAV